MKNNLEPQNQLVTTLSINEIIKSILIVYLVGFVGWSLMAYFMNAPSVLTLVLFSGFNWINMALLATSFILVSAPFLYLRFVTQNRTIINPSFINKHITKAYFPEATIIDQSAFEDCTNLQEAHFPKATDIGDNAFYYCSTLEEANFPKTIDIGNSAFYRCYKLQQAHFPQATSIRGYALTDCENLQKAYFPQAKVIGEWAFHNCHSLQETHFPQATSIGLAVFSKCTNLQQTHCPLATEIGEYAFYQCSQLQQAYFPKVTTIKNNAFEHCNNLKHIILPETISKEEKTRIGLSPNTIVIPTDDFDDSLWNFNPTLVTKLYSQGPVLAKALLLFCPTWS